MSHLFGYRAWWSDRLVSVFFLAITVIKQPIRHSHCRRLAYFRVHMVEADFILRIMRGVWHFNSYLDSSPCFQKKRHSLGMK